MSRKLMSVVATIVFAAATVSCTNEKEPATPSADSDGVCRLEALYPVEIRDKALFVQDAENVFVGQVLSSKGQHVEEDHTPHSQFSVKVIDNIKGTLPQNVSVSQTGGVVNNALCLRNGDPLLTDGSVYIFTTRYSKELDLHFITASHYGDIKLSPADSATVLNGTGVPPAVAEMRRAAENPPQPK
ncbi:hypothetical protein [Mycobacterium sp. NPDC050853]|uniref:hypothetical protein n=1 Tax=Mycobacterium sp. NPDC050853 TaxID=3155160 RepID=UPI0033F1FBAC